MTRLPVSTSTNRIELIDAFRGIAILLVIFFHYYYRFAPPLHDSNLYPYPPVEFPLIAYGFYGVQLFFIISGFVISLSLEKSNTWSVFLKHRFARLFPAMLLCSAITFIFISLTSLPHGLAYFESNRILNFLPGLTFTTPIFWNFLLGRDDIQYIDGVYWSLWTEVFFYLSAALIFFSKRNNFLMIWIRVTVALQIIRIVTSPKVIHFYPDYLADFADIAYRTFFVFNLNFWVYFSVGIFMYALYSKKRIAVADIFLMIFLILLEYYFLHDVMLCVLFTAFMALFAFFVYKPTYLKALRIKPLIFIGLVSYPMYLLHQNIGVVLISNLSVESNPGINVFIPLLILLFLVLVSYLIYRYYEKPIIKFFRK